MRVGLKEVSMTFWTVVKRIRCARTHATKGTRDKPVHVKVMRDALCAWDDQARCMRHARARPLPRLACDWPARLCARGQPLSPPFVHQPYLLGVYGLFLIF